LASRLGLSRFALGKKFRRERGITLGAYFKQQQIKRAEKLLRTTRLSIATMARRAAFKGERTFHRAFHRETGTTPGAYRRRATNR
jgi:AraC-like DNA-binding protein